MTSCSGPQPISVRTFDNCLQFTVKWVPRTITAGLAGYYCLGAAYAVGLMAAIDQVAIRILRPSMGLIALGAFMPTFQWYKAWGVRFAAGIAAGILYDLTIKICRVTFSAIFQRNQKKQNDQTAQ